jgi:hypothetical protein
MSDRVGPASLAPASGDDPHGDLFSSYRLFWICLGSVVDKRVFWLGGLRG